MNELRVDATALRMIFTVMLMTIIMNACETYSDSTYDVHKNVLWFQCHYPDYVFHKIFQWISLKCATHSITLIYVFQKHQHCENVLRLFNSDSRWCRLIKFASRFGIPKILKCCHHWKFGVSRAPVVPWIRVLLHKRKVWGSIPAWHPKNFSRVFTCTVDHELCCPCVAEWLGPNAIGFEGTKFLGNPGFLPLGKSLEIF